MTDYATFLTTKRRTATAHGRTITDADVHPMLHPWQTPHRHMGRPHRPGRPVGRHRPRQDVHAARVRPAVR